jgi:hypothetical protein
MGLWGVSAGVDAEVGYEVRGLRDAQASRSRRARRARRPGSRGVCGVGFVRAAGGDGLWGALGGVNEEVGNECR